MVINSIKNKLIDLNTIEKIVGSRSNIKPECVFISQILTDSRQSANTQHTLFIAIKGDRHDGHNYIKHLIEKGFKYFIVHHDYNENADKGIYFLRVDNTLSALQALATYKRKLFHADVIGVTGSNGKTIVKEWLHQILSQSFSTIKSPKSYNSQIGVSLSVWPLNSTYSTAIIEAGISQNGEMARLSNIVNANYGILTNLGSAHDEGFSSRTEKLKEKLLLFKQAKFLVYRKDHTLIDDYLSSCSYFFEQISWSTNADGAVYQVTFNKKQACTFISIWKESMSWNFSVAFTDEASLENVTHCIIFCLAKGIKFNFLQESLSKLHSVTMRMEIQAGINNCHLINDAYNNDLIGLKMALDFAFQQFPDKKHSLILSDFLQAGDNEKELFFELEKLLASYNLHQVFSIGEKLAKLSFFDKHWKTTNLFLNDKFSSFFDEEVILIKGARVFAFENIVTALTQKKHITELSINLNAIAHNLNYYRSKLKYDTKVLVMVKAFGYGSGSHEIAHLLQYQQVDYLGVAYVDEGVSLRKAGIQTPILVLNTSTHELDRVVNYKLEPEVFSFRQLQEIIDFTHKRKTKIGVHIKVDTGMHRLGFLGEEIAKLSTILEQNQQLEVKSIFSHLAASEDINEDEFTKYQFSVFKRAVSQIESKIKKTCMKHILNSSGISRFPDAQFDMVRLGIGLYGISNIHAEQSQLMTVGTLTTSISQIKKITKGETIGYNRKGKVLELAKMIGIIPIGYADGYDRRLGNGVGKVHIKNKGFAPTIGNICMDMCMIDLTGLDVKENDNVELFGVNMPVSNLAKLMKTIPYEVLTNISERVVRVFVQE